MIDSLLALILGVLLDYCFGEPRKYHPLVGFGKWASFIEKRLNRQSYSILSIARGAFAWLLALGPITMLMLYLNVNHNQLNILFNGFIVYLCIGFRSLQQHCFQALDALYNNNLEQARIEVAKIVSRETTHLGPLKLRQATIESVLENGLDAVFAAMFWFLLAGAPGIVLYRLANTLDAMWGYKNQRFLYFGRFSAYVDDVLNWLPARLVASSYAVIGDTPKALQAWKRQARLCKSPNGGPVMCAGAGALSIVLGGDSVYHGKLVKKPSLGFGELPTNQDLLRAIQLVFKTLVLWCTVLAFTTLLVVFAVPLLESHSHGAC